jgi:predicted CoA-binding protein
VNTIEEILRTCHTIAVVGLSPDPDRTSYRVADYMRQAGYNIIPVNPMCKEVFGNVSYPKLTDIPVPVDAVNVFRRPEEVPAIVADAIKIKAKAIWLQEGITSEEGRKMARAAGLLFVADQ